MMRTPTATADPAVPPGLDESEVEAITPPFDLVVSDACWNWTERLFAPLADLGCRLLLLKAFDWRNAVQQRRPPRDWFFPLRQRNERLWEQTCILPPGWMKTYPKLGMRPIAAAVMNWRRQLADPRPLALAINYPHYLYLRDQLRPDMLVYYNTDDYGLYWPGRREVVRRLERRVVAEADLSVFIARSRADELRQAMPIASDRIIHLPLGAPASAIAPAPREIPAPAPADIADLPRPLLGYVGSMEDRIDWPLIEHLSDEFPDGSIVLIGRAPDPAPRRPWYRDYLKAVDRPNVHCLGWRSQEEIGRYNAAFDVCLIPYRADHPFNRAACPTKVMDYMATSRPVVSTSVPECRLYADLFDVAETPAEFVAAARSVVARGSDDGRASRRWATARARTWERMAETLFEHLRAAGGVSTLLGDTT